MNRNGQVMSAITRRSTLELGAMFAITAAAVGRYHARASSGHLASGRVLGEREFTALRRMCRILFPHPALSDAPYDAAVEALAARAKTESAFSALLRVGVQALDGKHRTRWLSQSDRDAVAILDELQKTKFFAAVHDTARARIYAHPETWKLIGYEGSSIEKGGYLHRGFDDINWLLKQ